MKKIALPFFFSVSAVLSFAQTQKVIQNSDVVFHNTVKMLDVFHYSPRKIDDSLSVEVFNAYLKELDPGKRFFLASDLDTLKAFQYSLDDEMLGEPVRFYPKVSSIYQKRLTDAGAIVTKELAKPFTFSGTDVYDVNAESAHYAKTGSELEAKWRVYLKYRVLAQYDGLLQQRQKDSTLPKNDTLLQQRARDAVARSEQRFLAAYSKAMSPEESLSRYLNTIVNIFDPHSEYFLPVDRRAFKEELSGIYYGIGALLQQDPQGKVKIGELMIGGPAWKSKLVDKDDILIKVQEGNQDSVVDIEGMNVNEIVRLTRGQKGSTVTITFRKKDGAQRAVTLKREPLTLDDSFVKSAVIDDGGRKIGYITFPKFYTNFGDSNARSCTADMAREIVKLKQQKVDGLIVDIRDNGGGSLEEVINMVGLFTSGGPVVQVKSSRSRPQTGSVEAHEPLYTGPLAVMVNEGSASASEIFAAAIQDYHRGVIVGSASTYGKGTVQRAFQVPYSFDRRLDSNDLGTINITLQKFYRITGKATQRRGVQSDVVLPGIYSALKIQEKDNQWSLPWDTIASLSYKAAPGASSIEPAAAHAQSFINRDTTLTALNKELALLGSRREVYSLNLEKYRKEIAEVSRRNELITKQFRSAKPITVENTPEMEKSLQLAEQFRKDSNKAWLTNLSKDLYLSTTLTALKPYLEQASAPLAFRPAR